MTPVSLLFFLIPLPFLLIFSLLAFLLFAQIRNHLRYKAEGCNIPRAKERPFLGSKIFIPLHEDLLLLRKTYGPIVYAPQFHLRRIVCTDPDICQMALVKDLLPKGQLIDTLADFWGLNLFTMNHETEEKYQIWKKERALLNPCFKLSSLRALHPRFERHSLLFVQRYLDSLKGEGGGGRKGEGRADFYQEFCKFTLDVISDAGFGFDIGAFKEGGNGAAFLKALHPFMKLTSNSLMILPYGSKILKWLRRKELKVIDEVMYQVIDARMKEISENKGKRDPNRKLDLLDLLIESEENGAHLSRTALRNELFIFYLAGHETAADILSWALHSVVSHPEVEQKVLDEINEVMGKAEKGKIEAPSLDHIEKMAYLEMVFNETLRLYPPAMALNREVRETFTHNGLVFPKGSVISVPIFLVQRDERFWENPLEFRPERFSKENLAGLHPFAFFPFGAGPRICIGRNFFYQEAKIVFATLLRSLQFRADPKNDNSKMESSANLLRPSSILLFYSERDL